MLFRFSLYGFLKNQRYFEPFLMLALLDHGLNFLQIGSLISLRELTSNALEIPTGAWADGWSRRGSMIVSFVAYIFSFVVFAFADNYWLLCVAMILFAVGDSFRTGTHKAMIFEWLRIQDRTSERTQVYGFTRSWSQIGSAVSGVIAAVCVLMTQNYQAVFLFSTIPYALNIFNFMGYPKELDGSHERTASVGHAILLALRSLRRAMTVPRLRRLMLESMGWEGYMTATRDYLQTAVMALAVSVFIHHETDLSQADESESLWQTAVLVGVIFPILFLMTSLASRWSHRIEKRFSTPDRAASNLWACQAGLFLLLLLTDLMDLPAFVVLMFILLQVLLNVWRPILVSRFDAAAEASEGATVLSIENQSQSLATFIAAPLIGWAIDWSRQPDVPGLFWPIGLGGVLISLVAMILARVRVQNGNQ